MMICRCSIGLILLVCLIAGQGVTRGQDNSDIPPAPIDSSGSLPQPLTRDLFAQTSNELGTAGSAQTQNRRSGNASPSLTSPKSVVGESGEPPLVKQRTPRAHTEIGTIHFPEHLGTIRVPEMPRETYTPDMLPQERKVEAEFADGLTVKTDDGYFSLTFHNLTQVDYREFSQTGPPLSDSFAIPRQRWYVLGNISQNVRYYTVINRGYNSLDLLDAFVDLNFGLIDREKLQIRVGRTKTPFSYEYIKISETDLIAAERSVYVGNLAPNRELGAMIHGKLLDRSLEYAIGVFNGPRRSFEDSNNAKDVFTFFNLKPFLHGDSDVLRQVNVSGSFNFGDERNVAQPNAFRTANDQSTGANPAVVSPTFLQFSNTVFEDGARMQWSGDVMYYYKSFGILGGYQGGVQNYGVATQPVTDVTGVTAVSHTRVPMSGFSVTSYYFLTGEEITRRANVLEPREPFTSLRPNLWKGPGAVECFARFANIQLGNSVFSGGLADPTLWSNRANVTDIGVNWYVNRYTKLTFDWQYSDFGKSVSISPTNFTSFNNLYWFRTQIFF